MPDLDTREHVASGPVRVRTRKGAVHDLTLEDILLGAEAVTEARPSRVWVRIDERLLPAIDVITHATGHTTSENQFTWNEITRVLTALGLSVQRGLGQWASPVATRPGFATGSYGHATQVSPMDIGSLIDTLSDPRRSTRPLSTADAEGGDGDQDDPLLESPLTVDAAAKLNEHSGRWVALRDQHVVAVADSPDDACSKARATNSLPVMVVFVPTTGSEDPALP